MEKPKSFAGRVIRKGGHIDNNDHPQPSKFFADLEDCLKVLDDIPFSAVEELEKYESEREIIIKIIKRCFRIMEAAKVDIIEEMKKIDSSPFDGLEEDIALKKAKINKLDDNN